MLKKCTSITVVMSLIFTLGAASALANPIPDLDTKSKPAKTPVNSPGKSETTSKHKRNEKLRADVEKLLSDAREGKVVLPERRQMKPAKSNNLSKGAKIAIGVGIAVVVIALIVKYQMNHFFDDFRLGN
ncbi:MAG TPA: hypothetical protein VI750_14240 [Pyrinomonadaceae bacterium]|nr:hypothetical protein [Pyrinomonadaceae bacterium]